MSETAIAFLFVLVVLGLLLASVFWLPILNTVSHPYNPESPATSTITTNPTATTTKAKPTLQPLTTSSPNPPGFQGPAPNNQPHIIGPTSPPPRYGQP